MNSALLRTDLEQFEKAVKKLGSGISKASPIWSDEKYSELFASVQTIARNSKEVLVNGESACKSVDQLVKIASEKY